MKYLPQLDGLRALAIVMVFLHHAYGVSLAWSGVDLFFILSGYLITNILLRDREHLTFGKMLGKFYLRRAERILPAYALFLVIAYFLVPVHWGHLWGYYVGFMQNVPLAQGKVTEGALLPLWSLAVEQHFYLVWPLVVYFLPRRWLGPCMVGLLLGVPLLRAVCTPLFSTAFPIYVLTPFRMDAIAAGALAAIVLPHCNPKRTIRFARLAMLLGVIGYLLLGAHPWFRRTANTVSFNTLAYSLNILVLGGLFVWAVLSRDTPLTRVLSHRMLRGLGRISYMFYLLHFMVLLAMQRRLGVGLAGPAAFAMTCVLATLSWFLLEKPILSLSSAHRRAAPTTPTAV